MLFHVTSVSPSTIDTKSAICCSSSGVRGVPWLNDAGLVPRLPPKSPPLRTIIMTNRIKPPIPPPMAFLGTLMPLLSSTFGLLLGSFQRTVL